MVSLSHKRAQKSVICPLCGATTWRKGEGLVPLRLFPANKVLLGESRLIHLCPACLAQLMAVPESERWLFYLEWLYSRFQPELNENHGHKDRRK